jgi:putative ABC transport system ATP-binding protein
MDREDQGNYKDPHSLLDHNHLTDEKSKIGQIPAQSNILGEAIRDEEAGHETSPVLNDIRRNIPQSRQLPTLNSESPSESLPPIGFKKVPVRNRKNGEGAYSMAKPNYKLDKDISADQKTPISVGKDIVPEINEAQQKGQIERANVSGLIKPTGDRSLSPAPNSERKNNEKNSNEPNNLSTQDKKMTKLHKPISNVGQSGPKEIENNRQTVTGQNPQNNKNGVEYSQMTFSESPRAKVDLANRDPVDRDMVIASEMNKILNKKDDDDSSQFVVKMDNIQKAYLIGVEAVAAVRGIDLSVKRGEFLCILGTSGGGKSTLLNCMGTIDTPSRGNLRLFGEYMRSSTSDSHYAKIRLNKIGFVFQSFNLIGTMTAMENVELPMLLKGDLSRDQVRDRARKLLHDVNLHHRLHHYPNMLSGGEQQRVTIARALSNEPELLLMDEPTGDLDTKNSDLIIKILMDLNKEGITMVMVTHDENMKKYAHRVVHIMDGKLASEQIIHPNERTKAINDLEEMVASYGDPEEHELGVRGGINKNEQTSKTGLTEDRKLENYDYFKFLMKRKQEKERAAQENASRAVRG